MGTCTWKGSFHRDPQESGLGGTLTGAEFGRSLGSLKLSWGHNDQIAQVPHGNRQLPPSDHDFNHRESRVLNGWDLMNRNMIISNHCSQPFPGFHVTCIVNINLDRPFSVLFIRKVAFADSTPTTPLKNSAVHFPDVHSVSPSSAPSGRSRWTIVSRSILCHVS